MVGSCQLFKEKYAGKLSFHECVATQVFELRYAILNWPILDAKGKRYDTSGANRRSGISIVSRKLWSLKVPTLCPLSSQKSPGWEYVHQGPIQFR